MITGLASKALAITSRWEETGKLSGNAMGLPRNACQTIALDSLIPNPLPWYLGMAVYHLFGI
jgi:hypothetical protein